MSLSSDFPPPPRAAAALTAVPGVYFVVCMALLVISLTETVLIVRLVHKQDLQTPVPDWVRYLVLERAPVLLCIHRKHRLCSRLSSQGSDLDRYKDSNYGTSKEPAPHWGSSCREAQTEAWKLALALALA